LEENFVLFGSRFAGVWRGGILNGLLAKKPRQLSIQFRMFGAERMGTLEERLRDYGEELCRIFRAVGI